MIIIQLVIFSGFLIKGNENKNAFYMEHNNIKGYWISEDRVIELIKAEKEQEILKKKITNLEAQILLLNSKVTSYENLNNIYKIQLKDYNKLKMKNKIFSITTPVISISFAVILTGAIVYIIINRVAES